MSDSKTVVAAALGECVHVAGVMNFLRLAEAAGWQTVFLGPAAPVERVLAAAREHNASLVGVSYRLTPETGERLLAEFAEAADDLRAAGVRFAFGGTPPVAERARAIGFFEQIFDGSEPTESVLAYLKGQPLDQAGVSAYPQATIERIGWKAPFPLLRHHFGLPTMEATRAGIEQIAEARVLDVISLGIDQDAQENFFHPERQDPRRTGAGGVPVRSADDYRSLYAASRRGNYPLLRTYSGTDDFVRLAEMYVETINIAWAAVPLFWFNAMDGRGPHDLEILDPDAPGAAGLVRGAGHPGGTQRATSLGHARRAGRGLRRRRLSVGLQCAGVWRTRLHRAIHVQQPARPFRCHGSREDAGMPGNDRTAGRADTSFRIYRQTRVGLLSHPLDPEAARGHLAAATYLQMALKPHIVHVVGHTEAHHAATAEDVIAACKVARRAVENAVAGAPDMTLDPRVQARKRELLAETQITLDAIRALGGPEIADPLADPATLARAVTSGILDAPHLRNNPYGHGRILTRIDARGACVAVDAAGRPLSETYRLAELRQ